jgi:hypothetical protein
VILLRQPLELGHLVILGRQLLESEHLVTLYRQPFSLAINEEGYQSMSSLKAVSACFKTDVTLKRKVLYFQLFYLIYLVYLFVHSIEQ